MADIDVTNNNFTKIVSGLIPATNYDVTIDAMTSAGGVESAPLKVTTFAAGKGVYNSFIYSFIVLRKFIFLFLY